MPDTDYMRIDVGDKFPFNIAQDTSQMSEYAFANFFQSDHNSFVIGIEGGLKSDIEKVNFNDIEVGIYAVKFPIILIMLHIKGMAVFDCSLDMKLIQEPVFPTIDDENTRLLVNLYCIESKTQEILGMRIFTLSPKITSDLIETAKNQLNLNYTSRQYNIQLLDLQRKNWPAQLMQFTDMEPVGI
jgi:hypothetical protein